MNSHRFEVWVNSSRDKWDHRLGLRQSRPCRETGVARARALVADSEGKLYVVGYVEPVGDRSLVLPRFQPDGSIDTTDGDGGRHIYTPEVGSIEGTGVAIGTDGKIYVSATLSNGASSKAAVLRFNP